MHVLICVLVILSVAMGKPADNITVDDFNNLHFQLEAVGYAPHQTHGTYTLGDCLYNGQFLSNPEDECTYFRCGHASPSHYPDHSATSVLRKLVPVLQRCAMGTETNLYKFNPKMPCATRSRKCKPEPTTSPATTTTTTTTTPAPPEPKQAIIPVNEHKITNFSLGDVRRVVREEVEAIEETVERRLWSLSESYGRGSHPLRYRSRPDARRAGIAHTQTESDHSLTDEQTNTHPGLTEHLKRIDSMEKQIGGHIWRKNIERMLELQRQGKPLQLTELSHLSPSSAPVNPHLLPVQPPAMVTPAWVTANVIAEEVTTEGYDDRTADHSDYSDRLYRYPTKTVEVGGVYRNHKTLPTGDDSSDFYYESPPQNEDRHVTDLDFSDETKYQPVQVPAYLNKEKRRFTKDIVHNQRMFTEEKGHMFTPAEFMAKLNIRPTGTMHKDKLMVMPY